MQNKVCGLLRFKMCDLKPQECLPMQSTARLETALDISTDQKITKEDFAAGS